MEAFLAALFAFMADRFSDDTLILMVLLTSLIIVYKYVLKPIYDKVHDTPSTAFLETVAQAQLDGFLELKEKLDNLERNLDSVQVQILAISQNSAMSDRDIQELKREITEMRNIILQFQGHMIYGNADLFGNKGIR